MTDGADAPPRWMARLPFYYGWVVVGIAFVTMAVAVSARTAFSLLLPPLIDEFGWDRGTVAGAFSFGFVISATLSPVFGRVIDRHGPRFVLEIGVALAGAGMLLAPFVHQLWQLYGALGMLVGTGTNLMSYSVQSQYLPNWFVRRRGLAVSIAFSGVGAGAILLLPWLQTIILQDGWRAACQAIGLLMVLILGPLNLFVWRRPEVIGLLPDGARTGRTTGSGRGTQRIVDPAWAATEWTLRRALATARFWWVALGFCLALVSWYAVQVHQTKYLVEIGFSPVTAAWALGIVSVVAIPGQIGFGALSDRIGREAVWSIGCLGFAICYAALIGLARGPSVPLLYAMVMAQGFLGYALTSVMGAIAVEIFEGPHFGAIFGVLNVASVTGGALGPWMAGVVHDATGSYTPAFAVAMGCSVVSAAAIWLAAPRKVRTVRA